MIWLLVYLFGLLPAWVLYARWLYSVDKKNFPSLPPDTGPILAIAAALALLWPVGWLIFSIACIAAGLSPIPRFPIGDWLKRQVFRGM